MKIICSHCAKPYPATGLPYRCPDCYKNFNIYPPIEINLDELVPQMPGMWRFINSFQLPHNWVPISLGEGSTPFINLRKHGSEIGCKLENLNPTGSFKDRGSAALINHMVSRGITHCVEDSSGNAGASLSAYAAKAGIAATIFIPESASGPKRTQIEIHGSRLMKVPGPRSEAANAVIQAVDEDSVYASHAYLPFGSFGIATIAYELWLELGEVGSIIAPVGHGGLLHGIMLGFDALRSTGYIAKPPYMVGVQAAACAPAVAMYYGGSSAKFNINIESTVAEGVRITDPVSADAIITWMKKEGGHFVAIEEARILPAAWDLAMHGISIEPTSALAWAALDELVGKIPEPIIIILTGSGLKYQQYS